MRTGFSSQGNTGAGWMGAAMVIGVAGLCSSALAQGGQGSYASQLNGTRFGTIGTGTPLAYTSFSRRLPDGQFKYQYHHDYDDGSNFFFDPIVTVEKPGANAYNEGRWTVFGGSPPAQSTHDVGHLIDCTAQSTWKVETMVNSAVEDMYAIRYTTTAKANAGWSPIDQVYSDAKTWVWDPYWVENPNPGQNWWVGGRVSFAGLLQASAPGSASWESFWDITPVGGSTLRMYDASVGTSSADPVGTVGLGFAQGVVLQRDGVAISAATLRAELLAGFTSGATWDVLADDVASGTGVWFDWFYELDASVAGVEVSNSNQTHAYDPNVPTPATTALLSMGVGLILPRRRGKR